MWPLALVVATGLAGLEPTELDGGASEDGGTSHPEPPRQPTAQLDIQVRTMGTREPLALAQVQRSDGGLAGETDDDGHLTLELEPGPVSLRVFATGHLPQTFSETLVGDERLEVIYRLEPSGSRPYETKVHGNRYRTELVRTAVSNSEAHEIAGTQGEPLRVIMLLPGVAPLASGLAYPVVRGAQPAATAFFLDDIRVPQLFHALVGPAVVHPALIDRVDFFSGVPPARFGRLMSGAVEAQMARPRTSGFTAQGSVDLLNASTMAEIGFPSTGSSITLAGRYSYTALLGTAIARSVLPSDPPRTPIANFWDYQARLEQRIGDGRLRLLALGASDEVGAVSASPNDPSGVFLSNFHRVDLRWTGPQLGGEFELGATFGPETVGVQGEEGGARSFQFLLSRTITAFRARHRHSIGDQWRVEVGADLEWQKATVELLGHSDLAKVPITDFREPMSTGIIAALWAQVGFQHRSFLANVGLRTELYHLDPDITIPAIAPRVQLRQGLTDQLEVRASAGLVQQPPTVLLNLPITDLAGLRHGLQTGLQLEAGVTARPFEEISFDFALFHHTLFRAVEYGLEQLVDTRRNLADGAVGVPGRSYGAELTVRKDPAGRWFGWLTATLMRSERFQTIYRFDGAGEIVGPPVDRWVAFAFDQTLILNGTAGVRLGRGWQVGASAHFHTGRPESGEITSRGMQQGFDPVAQKPIWVPVALDRVPRLPPFFRLDVRVSKLWRYNDFTLEAFLDVLNVTLSREVLAWQYTRKSDGTLIRTPLDVPLVLPQIGLKGAY
jgi:hypothetical protein